ncbi:hypothetical protein Ade02nite_87100 [Paractinoplanes deccanensis]|uniref:Uncharacterized protein n=1 Tax=Paractinoplanes deccanensis TaxID=113561 RepID=A0ABQ3YJ93_9ACTN|nr:hypothetical protein [Actinoplanes deccanensis]GID80069.1 hypothetical protein Ade02nite_87100 [Actinoplanes deccanensis]
MAALIMVRPGVDWQSTGGLFEWTLEYLIPRIDDPKTADWLRMVVAENLGSLWIPDLPEEGQREIYALLRSGLVVAAQQELPEGPAKRDALAQLRDLVALTY